MDNEYYVDDIQDDKIEYYVEGVDGVDEENIENENADKDLIAIVKANPILWDKRLKEYSGKNFNKEFAWASVAAMLKNISGSEAAKKFYKIRQRYGKERRKVILSLKGKSGQGSQSIYVPTWELYDLCDSFLRNVVIPRKTTSNYIKKATSTAASNEITIQPSTLYKVVLPEYIKAPVASHIKTAQTSNTKWSSDFYASLSNNDTTTDSDSITLESSKILESSTQQMQAQFLPSKPSSSVTEIEPVLQTEEATTQQILKTMSRPTAKTVPSSDIFNKKKRKIDVDFTHEYNKRSEKLDNLATKVSQALEAKKNTALIPTAISDPILGAIQMALTKVSEANKFQCMLDILQYINDKYVKTDG